MRQVLILFAIAPSLFRNGCLPLEIFEEKTIGIIPKNLYRDGNKPYSKSSIECLELISVQTKTQIQHALHGDERVIVDEELRKTYHVDGFCKQIKSVYEFYGCVYHACPLCFDRANDHPFHS